MKSVVFARIAEILSNLDLMIEGANICDEAYAEGVGQPEWHVPFGIDKPETVAQNVAGIQAVISSIGAIHVMRGFVPGAHSEMTLKILVDIANSDLSPNERSIVLRMANCAWGAGQSFRTDKGPLGRLTRMNVFDLLPEEEIEKDMIQVRAAAKWLLSKM